MDTIDNNTLFELAEALVIDIIIAWTILAYDEMLEETVQRYTLSIGLRSMYTNSDKRESQIAMESRAWVILNSIQPLLNGVDTSFCALTIPISPVNYRTTVCKLALYNKQLSF